MNDGNGLTQKTFSSNESLSIDRLILSYISLFSIFIWFCWFMATYFIFYILVFFNADKYFTEIEY